MDVRNRAGFRLSVDHSCARLSVDHSCVLWDICQIRYHTLKRGLNDFDDLNMCLSSELIEHKLLAFKKLSLKESFKIIMLLAW